MATATTSVNSTVGLSVPARARPTASQRRPSITPRQPGQQPIADTRRRLWQAVEKASSLYQYCDIGKHSIRLLTIHPKYGSSRDERKMFVGLTEVPISQLRTGPRKYEALSYHWGDEEADSIIYMRDESPMLANVHSQNDTAPPTQSKWREFRIKPNLYEALTHLRHDVQPFMFWIDALCIWQSKKEEKEHQVSMMDKIYSNAETVLVWLGSPNDGTKNAMQFIPKLVDLDKVSHFVNDIDECNVQVWMDFLQLIRREWFSRRWVVQELALAREAVMLCGEEQVNWVDFRDAVSLFARNIDSIQELLKRTRKHERHHNVLDGFEGMGVNKLLKMINNIFRTSRAGEGFEPDPIQGLEYLVSALFGFHSSDPRDTIHALRNIAKEKNRNLRGKSRKPPTPDYSKDLLETYVDFVKWVEESTGYIDIICRYWAQPEKSKEEADYTSLVKLPSWIQQNPTFESKRDIERRINGDVFVGLPGRGSYNACNGFWARVRYGARSNLTDRESPLYRSTSGLSKDSKRLREDSESATDTSAAKRPRKDTVDIGVTALLQSSIRDAGILHSSDKGEGIAAPRRQTLLSKPKPAVLLSTAGLGTQEERNEAWRRTIQVEGLLVGQVDWATDPIPDGVIPANVLEILGHPAGSEDWPTDKLWRTLVAERDEHGNNPPPWYSRACHYCLLNGTPNGHINTGDLLRQTQPDDVKDFLKRVQAVTWNRVFLVAKRPVPPLASPYSEDGNSLSIPSVNVSRVGSPEPDAGGPQLHDTDQTDIHASQSRPSSAQGPVRTGKRPRALTLEVPEAGAKIKMPRLAINAEEKLHGLGPSDARRNDIVCILFGCTVPCILRPGKDCLGDFYSFVGEAYIYGLMDGEAVPYRSDEESAKDPNRQKFEIR